MRSSLDAADDQSGALACDLALSPRALSDLIGSIYDCVLDPSLWERSLWGITRIMPGESAILSLNDRRRDRLVIDKNVGWGQFGIEERQKHIPEIHARLNAWFARGPSLDEPFVASRELPPAYLERAPYVQHCLKPLGIVDIMHLFLVYTPSHFSELVIGRNQRQGPVTEREIKIGLLLLPHLRRAVSISNVLDARAIERAGMAETLDALRCGVILIDDQGTILHANRPAEQMLRNGTVVQDRGGIFKPKAPDAARELSKAIRLATRNESTLGKTGLAVRLVDTQGTALFARVLPLNGGQLRTQLWPQASAAIFISESMASLDLTPTEANEYLRHRFGLTKAEADVTLEILKNSGRNAVATRLGISMTTVRTHLSNIFDKTGVRRQADLVRLLLEGERARDGSGR